ncbi:MAG: hypothetical protein Q8N94_08335 [Methanoregula sp.]|nr:hypothetical protein [Methanoregula sp.]
MLTGGSEDLQDAATERFDRPAGDLRVRRYGCDWCLTALGLMVTVLVVVAVCIR